MKAAGLKPIDTVYESTAMLIKSKRPSDEELVQRIASRISGVISQYILISSAKLSSPNSLQPPRSTYSVNTTFRATYSKELQGSHLASERQLLRPLRTRNGTSIAMIILHATLEATPLNVHV